jgi:hypothetical protein
MALRATRNSDRKFQSQKPEESAMNQSASRFASVLLFTLLSGGAVAGPSNTGAPDVPANRIVGLWSTAGLVGPCGGTPINPVRNTLLFQAGGTVVENPRFPPNGAPNVFGVPGTNQRNQALGTWWYDPATKKYSMHLRFDWFVDGVYHGYMTIDREIRLSTDGMQASGPVWAARFDANDNQIAQLCGGADSTRL